MASTRELASLFAKLQMAQIIAIPNEGELPGMALQMNPLLEGSQQDVSLSLVISRFTEGQAERILQ